jgi:hypothetical protein
VTWLFLLVLCLSSCGGPPLRVQASSVGITIDIQTLGEYQTSVARIRLTDQTTRSVLWEVVAKEGTPQIHRIELKRGANNSALADVVAWTFQTIIPANAEYFSLPENHSFAIEVWAPSGGSSRVSFR